MPQPECDGACGFVLRPHNSRGDQPEQAPPSRSPTPRPGPREDTSSTSDARLPDIIVMQGTYFSHSSFN